MGTLGQCFANTLRGYQPLSIGRLRYSPLVFSRLQQQKDPLGNRTFTDAQAAAASKFIVGGQKEAFYNGELEFPLITEAGIKGVVFYDMGNADDELVIPDFRSNTGFGFRWFSPIGPLRFEWGFPINPRGDNVDQPSQFQFMIGSPF